MGNSILYRMASGIPGDISRAAGQATVESVPGDSANAFGAYGVPVKLSSGKAVPLAGGEAATAIYGMLVRPFPIQGANASDPLGTAVPPTGGIKDVMRRGYMTVKNNAGTPAMGGTVYVRVAAAAGGKPIGGIEAAADGTNTVVMAGATFMGGADSSGNVEIAFNI